VRFGKGSIVDWNKGKPVNVVFRWEYCEACEVWAIICPKCGNNCCNGGYGEVGGEECDVCPIAYEVQGKYYKEYPKTG